MRAFHYFGHNAEHHEATDVRDHRIMENAIVDFCVGSDKESAAFARTVTQDQVDHILLPYFAIAFDLHVHGILIQDDGLNYSSEIHQKTTQKGKLVRTDRNNCAEAYAKRIIKIFFMTMFVSHHAKIDSRWFSLERTRER